MLSTGSEQQGQNIRVRTVFLTLTKILDLLVFFIRYARIHILELEHLGPFVPTNSLFIYCRLYLSREEIDNPHKKAGRKVFRETFAIEVNFEEPEH